MRLVFFFRLHFVIRLHGTKPRATFLESHFRLPMLHAASNPPRRYKKKITAIALLVRIEGPVLN